ncbi:MAG: T9SS type A sorting domain-containing protein, partial [Crocinitomicaceae bacterium]
QPSCMPISNLTTNNIYTDSVSLTWTAGGIETSWNVQWGLPGFAPGTGAEIGAGSTPTTTYMINGLNPSTTYDIYVQANCGSDSSYWALVNATTLCAPISALPWTEKFDAMTTIGNNVFPNCWVDESGDWSSNNSINGQPYTAPNYVSMGSYGDDYLWTPEFNLTAGSTYEFAFRWIGNGSSQYVGGAYYSPSQSSIDAVQMGTNFINTTDLSSSTDYKKEIYCFTPTTSGVYSFGIHVTSGYSPKVLSFDNFSVRIPSPNAGTNGATTVCQTGGLVDLNSVITISDTTGVWAFSPNPSAIQNDTLFNPAFLPSGTTNVYYIVGGCIPDSAMATINIYPKSNAGTDGTISTCNYGPFNLFDGLTGSVDLGGQWYNPASQPIPGSIVNFNGQIAANYNYIYVVSNGVCPNDTSVIEIQLQDCAGVNEYELKGFVLYPNPSNGIINIQYSGKGEDVKLDVVDAKGAIVWSKQILFNDGTTQSIDISTVENGVYYINMTSKNGGSVMKVIKN